MSKLFRREEQSPTSAALAVLEAEHAEHTERFAVAPFVVGTLIGGLAGTIVGTALSPYTRGLVIGLYQLVSRRLSSAERDQLRFELLLQ